MPPDRTGADALGSSALLRVGGLPIRLWVAAGSPELFAQLRELEEQETRYRVLGGLLADRIGTELVPNDRLSARERRLALQLRRRLHNGEHVSAAACEALGAAANRVLASPTGLGDELGRAARRSARLSNLESEAARAVDRQQRELLRAPWQLVRGSPVAERALREGNSATFSDIAQRVRRGEAWEGKRLRRRSDYLWRMIARGATKTTPRHWLGHVALLHVSQDPLALFPLPGVHAEHAVHAIENVHARRRKASDTGLEAAGTSVRLAMAPLHWRDGGHMQFWVVDPADVSRMRDLRLRRTPLLDAVSTALQAGTRSLGELEDTLMPAADERQRHVLRAFLEHLTELGVLQTSMPPRARLDGWHLVAPAPNGGGPNVEVREGEDEFVDVYRRATAPLAYAGCLQLQAVALQAVRLLRLMHAGACLEERDPLPEVTERPRPVLELVAQRLHAKEQGASETERPRHRQDGWPAAADGSGYARLLEWMAARADDPGGIDITVDLLDALDAPENALEWPMDAMLRVLRPGTGPVAVLDHLAPAGTLDSRFASALAQLHGDVPQTAAYGAFLRELERHTGVAFVELLIPPLSDRAANAVRRPPYTRAWTGDADLDTYCAADGAAPPRYIPLNAITVRRRGTDVVAEVDGRRIWPVYHATRSPMPPWNLLYRFLRAASPPLLPWGRSLGFSLDALAPRSAIPRITVAGALVLSCAQWRITRDQLWDFDAPPLAKARALQRLRQRLGLPRWIFVASSPGGKPLPADLESLRAIPTLERLAAEAPEAGMVIEEMLPSPDQLAVADSAGMPGDRLASELLLRLPCDESPTAMAARLAPELSARPRHADSPTTPARGGESYADHEDTAINRPALRAGA